MNRVETVLVRALERDIEATLGSEGYLSLHPAVTRLGDVIWGWTGRGRGPHDRVTNAIGGLKGRTLASLIEQTRGILPPSLRALCSAVQAAHMEEDIVDAQEARRAAEGALAAKLASHGPEVYAAILAAIEEAEERGARVALEAAALGCSVMADRHQGDAKEVLREASEWIPKISLDLGLVV